MMLQYRKVLCPRCRDRTILIEARLNIPNEEVALTYRCMCGVQVQLTELLFVAVE